MRIHSPYMDHGCVCMVNNQPSRSQPRFCFAGECTLDRYFSIPHTLRWIRIHLRTGVGSKQHLLTFLVSRNLMAFGLIGSESRVVINLVLPDGT